MIKHEIKMQARYLLMLLLYFLDTFVNMVRYLQRVPLDVSIKWCFLHQDAKKTYSEIPKMRSYWKDQW